MKKMLYAVLLLAPLAQATEKNYGSVTVSKVGTIYDGDTFYVNIDRWPSIVGEHIAVRVKGVDTPEMQGKCDSETQLARKAKQFTVEFLRRATSIQLRNVSRDKYFRVLADVYVGEKNLARELISKGLGYEYHGESKKNWCAK